MIPRESLRLYWMNRLNFSLPEFTRISWASSRARDLWQPRIDAINNIWPKIERATVVSLTRSGTLQSIKPTQLMDIQEYCLTNDLGFVVLGQEASSDVYANASRPPQEGMPWVYRVYIGMHPRSFLELWKRGDDQGVANLLGYPECCARFFTRYWRDQSWRDLTYPMTLNGPSTGPAGCNILLRHIGVRPVFHLPCSFNCEETVRLANTILSYRSMGYEAEFDWLVEMLNWPMKWTSLHGVAILTTPVLKVVSSSDPLESQVVIERDGKFPEAGVNSSEFSSKPLNLNLPDTWTDNGFTSYHAMKQGHDLILGAIESVSAKKGNIIDFGCGNGVLLERIVRQFGTLIPFGVEFDELRYRRAQNRVGTIEKCDIFSFKIVGEYEIALISINRFLEVTKGEALNFLDSVRPVTNTLIVYAYDHWKNDLDSEFSRYFSLVGCKMNGNMEARIYRRHEA